MKEIGREAEIILQLGIVKYESERGRALDKKIETVWGARPPCDAGVFHDYSADFRKSALEPLNDWSKEQKKREQDLIDGICR